MSSNQRGSTSEMKCGENLVYKTRVYNLDTPFFALWDEHTDTHHQMRSSRISRTTNTPAFDASCIRARTRNFPLSCISRAANVCIPVISSQLS